ncbi:hypothetical protein BN871_FU_00030 [Paenibacillus sp. P22]|nr:hypothetical protein BN871_FU_00030 [Paenibacillus sp. P22]
MAGGWADASSDLRRFQTLPLWGLNMASSADGCCEGRIPASSSDDRSSSIAAAGIISVHRSRPAEQVALEQLIALQLQPIEILLLLDSLRKRDRSDPQGRFQKGQRGALLVRVPRDALHMLHVQLHVMGTQLRQQLFGAVSRPRIVQRAPESPLAVVGHNPLQMLRILDLVRLDHLEDEQGRIRSKLRGEIHGRPKAIFGSIDGRRDKIDEGPGLQRSRMSDRSHAASLVQRVQAPPLPGRLEHFARVDQGSVLPDESRQELIGVQLPVPVDDRLDMAADPLFADQVVDPLRAGDRAGFGQRSPPSPGSNAEGDRLRIGMVPAKIKHARQIRFRYPQYIVLENRVLSLIAQLIRRFADREQTFLASAAKLDSQWFHPAA